tara:strand:- start:685 stop:972 length:288 start_codon:yes stop_codon:yes gene_type:complete
MKVLIWIHKNDVISGKITKYYKFGPPQSTNWTDYVQIEITRDEFVRLEDKREDSENTDQWNIEQYNRNRDFTDQIKSVDEIISDIADQDDQPFAD